MRNTIYIISQSPVLNIFLNKDFLYNVNSDPRYLLYIDLMPFLKYRDNDPGLCPSYYPYILGMALTLYCIW